MHIVELSKRKCDKSKEDHPRLPSIELVMPIYDGAYQKFDSAFGDQKGMCGKDPTDGSKKHAPNETYSRSGTRMESFYKPICDQQGNNYDESSDHPNNELATPKEFQQLVQIMRRLRYSSKCSNEDCSGCYEKGTGKGVARERFAQDNGGAYRVKHKTGLD